MAKRSNGYYLIEIFKQITCTTVEMYKMIKINISLEAMSQPETLWHSKPQKSNQINSN